MKKGRIGEQAEVKAAEKQKSILFLNLILE